MQRYFSYGNFISEVIQRDIGQRANRTLTRTLTSYVRHDVVSEWKHDLSMEMYTPISRSNAAVLKHKTMQSWHSVTGYTDDGLNGSLINANWDG